MIIQIICWFILYCVSSTISIVLVGDRNLISGNLLSYQGIISLLFNWKFILAMALAVFSRISFILLNNNFLKVERLSSISTTLTTFVTTLSLIFVVLVNYIFLHEKLSTQQMTGAGIMLIGITLMMK